MDCDEWWSNQGLVADSFQLPDTAKVQCSHAPILEPDLIELSWRIGLIKTPMTMGTLHFDQNPTISVAEPAP